jgi:hypothetical protein
LETRWSLSALQRDNAALEERVRDRTKDLEEAQLEILQCLARAAEYRDDCTGHHTLRVGHLAGLLGHAIGLSAGQIELLRRAAPLHDVGKIGIPDAILLKPAKLSAEEYIQIKTHTRIGSMILSGSKFPILQMAERIALYHHERWDGLGYHGLAGYTIPLEARIVSIVDAFDVIMHARPYKEAETGAVAMERICRERGKQFDPALVDVFTQLDILHGNYDLSVPQTANGATPAGAWANPMERRKEPRIEINQEVTVTVLGEPDSLPFQAVAVDISNSGMRILSQRPVCYQATVKVEVQDLLLLGEVIRTQVCDRGNILALRLCRSLDPSGVKQIQCGSLESLAGHIQRSS